jgi:hypothetical protein
VDGYLCSQNSNDLCQISWVMAMTLQARTHMRTHTYTQHTPSTHCVHCIYTAHMLQVNPHTFVTTNNLHGLAHTSRFCLPPPGGPALPHHLVCTYTHTEHTHSTQSTHMHACMHAHIHTHTRTHARTHIRAHTYLNPFLPPPPRTPGGPALPHHAREGAQDGH